MEFFNQDKGKFYQPEREEIFGALKPKETLFDGYRYRSRLEARWAVLLKKLGIDFEYEKEGYELICGPYLPDFWLPYPENRNYSGHRNAGHWLEVKGQEPTQHELTKLLHLSIATGHSGILIWGTPWNFQRYFTHRSGNFGGPYRDEAPGNWSPESWNLHLMLCRHFNKSVSIDDAIMTAKAARFEHGERP